MTTISTDIQNLPLWDRMKAKRSLLSISFELTARCNCNCRHCYINMPPGNIIEKEKELSAFEICNIADQAIDLGAVWCLLTGGEPLLRSDFTDIYMSLKRKGLLLSVFTNATLINSKHVELFTKYPPRDIEITVYGATRETYESVTRVPGSYHAFLHGVKSLVNAGVKIRLKTMALKRNIQELDQIYNFCSELTKDYYRFDPFLHLRYDLNKDRNDEIRSERLSPEEIIKLEQSDGKRFSALFNNCDALINESFSQINSNRLFFCSTGIGDLIVSSDGKLRLCSSLCANNTIYDLKSGNLVDAINRFIPSVREMKSINQRFLDTCRKCPIINLCLWCPAHAYLETGELDGETPYFCQVAHARAEMLRNATQK